MWPKCQLIRFCGWRSASESGSVVPGCGSGSGNFSLIFYLYSPDSDTIMPCHGTKTEIQLNGFPVQLISLYVEDISNINMSCGIWSDEVIDQFASGMIANRFVHSSYRSRCCRSLC